MVDRVIRPPTLAEIAAGSIQDAIFRGDFNPGDPLRETQLCENLHVSRVTVREALRLLQEEGLVEITPHIGANVAKLSARTVREVYTVRGLLEPYAVRLALESTLYSEADFERIEAHLQRWRHLEQASSGSERFVDRIKADFAFHYLICQPSDHHVLLDILARLQSRSRLCVLYLHQFSPPQPLDAMGEESEHREIFKAIRQYDVPNATELVAQHLAGAKDQLLDVLAWIDQERSTSPTRERLPRLTIE